MATYNPTITITADQNGMLARLVTEYNALKGTSATNAAAIQFLCNTYLAKLLDGQITAEALNFQVLGLP